MRLNGKWKWLYRTSGVLVLVVLLINLFRNPWWIVMFRGLLAGVLFMLMGRGVYWLLYQNGLIAKSGEVLEDGGRLRKNGEVQQEKAGEKGQFVDLRSEVEELAEEFKPWVLERDQLDEDDRSSEK